MIWRNWIHPGPLLGLVLILVFGIPRFILVLNANLTANYQYVAWIFIILALLPFVFLSKEGRIKIGLKWPVSLSGISMAFASGIILCIAFFILGFLIYGFTQYNWFTYISFTYILPDGVLENQRFISFFIFALISMTFSPIGEELFYRGLVHECFANRYEANTASHIDSLAFALTHLAHFGIVWTGMGWKFLIVPSILWVTGIYLTGRLFYFCRKKTNSIWGAVLSHAGFNLAMTWIIFYLIL